MSRHFLKLIPSERQTAFRWIDRAIKLGQEGERPRPWLLTLKEPTRTEDQNAAMWSLLAQVTKQRPVHNGVKMDADLWKAVFMQAWGSEVVFLPNLEGDGMFPAGHRSSQLTVEEFTSLIDFILAWMAQQGLEIKHFDDRPTQGAE